MDVNEDGSEDGSEDGGGGAGRGSAGGTGDGAGRGSAGGTRDGTGGGTRDRGGGTRDGTGGGTRDRAGGGTGDGTDDGAVPSWWPYARDFPSWQVWRGVDRLYYAALRDADPPVRVRGEDPVDLRDQIRAHLLRPAL